MKVLKHGEAILNSISYSRKRPNLEVSSSVESGYNEEWKCSLDYSIDHHTYGISCHLVGGSTNHNCGDGYGAAFRLPSEFRCSFKQSADLVTLWGDSKSQCSVSHPRNHGQNTIVSKDLITCSQVFLRTDYIEKKFVTSIRRSL
ncbi:hypothetical protein TNIN_202441 [Trichonephila inaurata madagascariensis]|uniref:Uncharacterized protein n=1 Tax=Trichonephila inaurata madagascariensis TaxID=2747483 RepID=A0A8X6YLX7_9ARAC|nr:hypothetical protein TNIN_202441 [Trichonephila inaurata madagascariensis]